MATLSSLSPQNGIFTVDSSGIINIDLLLDGAPGTGELAIVRLTGLEELELGSNEFLQQAAIRALSQSSDGYVVYNHANDAARFDGSFTNNPDYNAGDYTGPQTYQLEAGSTFAMLWVENGSIAQAAQTPSLVTGEFSFGSVNAEGEISDRLVDVTGIGRTFGFDSGSIDGNFNDLVIEVQGATTNTQALENVMSPDQDWRSTALGQEIIQHSDGNGVFTVGDSGQISFEYLFDGGWYQGELAIYSLEGLGQHEIGSTAYIQEAAKRALSSSDQGYILSSDREDGAKFSAHLGYERDFNKGDYTGVKTFELEAGQKYGLFLVQNTGVKELADNPQNAAQSGKNALFSIPEANKTADATEFNQLAQLHQNGTFGFEGLSLADQKADRDYNEVVFQLKGATASAPFYGEVRNPGKNFRQSAIGKEILEYVEKNGAEDDGYFIVDQSGSVTFDFLFDGGWYEGEVGIFSLEGLDAYRSQSSEYIQAAAQRALSHSKEGYVLYQDSQEGTKFSGNWDWEKDYNAGEYKGKKQFDLEAGGKYGLIFAPKGTLQSATEYTYTSGQRPLFSLKNANPQNQVQLVQHADVDGEKLILGFEDIPANSTRSDRDYNDLFLSIEGASFYAPDYETVIDSQYNFAPVAENDTDTTFKDTAISISTDSLLLNDYDLDGDAIQFVSLDSTGTSGLVSLVNNQISYNPNGQFDSLSAGESIEDTFTYTISDDTGKTTTATASVIVKGFSNDGNENNVGTLDSLHLIPPLYAKNDVRDHYLVLSTLEETPFEVTIQNADGAKGREGGIHETVTISKDSPLIVDLSTEPYASGNGLKSLGVIGQSQVGRVEAQEGLVISGDQAFYANVRHQTKNQGLSLSSKGQLALGTEFHSGHLVTNDTYAHLKSHFISVMASEDNTTVSFGDLPEGVTFINGYPGNIVLNKYESYVVGVNILDNKTVANELQGTLITSDKPVAVNSGSWLGGTVGRSRDIGADQLVPTNLIGDQYILIKGESTSNANLLERPIIIATQDETEVYLRGEVEPFAVLSAGETLILDGNEFPSSDALLIETSHPSYVYQMTSANNNTAPGLNLALPVSENAGNQEILIPSIDQLGPGKLNIVARTSAEIFVDGSVLENGTQVDGAPEFLVYQVENLTGDVAVTSSESILVTSTTGGGNIGAAAHLSGLPTSLAFDDAVETTSAPITIDVLGNDISASNFRVLGFTEAPENGTVSLNNDSTITYTPDEGFSGTDVFVYRGINDNGKTDTALVNVSVNQNLLVGTVGQDTIIGSQTSDRILGLRGDDRIITNGGYDVLVFQSASEGLDTIVDFEVGIDQIDLTSILGSRNPLQSENVGFLQQGDNAVLQVNGFGLAAFENLQVAELEAQSNFVF